MEKTSSSTGHCGRLIEVETKNLSYPYKPATPDFYVVDIDDNMNAEMAVQKYLKDGRRTKAVTEISAEAVKAWHVQPGEVLQLHIGPAMGVPVFKKG